MKKYNVFCYFDEGDTLINFQLTIEAQSKTEALYYMETLHPHADGYSAELI